jgi:hypothetical protein
MVAAAADIIVLNGQGITNLPWLFHVADRTHAILKQVGWLGAKIVRRREGGCHGEELLRVGGD